MSQYRQLKDLCLTMPEQAQVARRADLSICSGRQWLSMVAAWKMHFDRCQGNSVSIFLHDAIEFSSALFGAWHSGKQVYLPGDDLPATKLELAKRSSIHIWSSDLDFSKDTSISILDVLDINSAELIVFTSGSTGTAVAIHKSLRQIQLEIDNLESTFGSSINNSEICGSVSHQHIYGLLFRVLWPLAIGRSFDAQPLLFTEQIYQRASYSSITLISSPALLSRLTQANAELVGHQLISKVFSSGGQLKTVDAVSACKLLGSDLIEVFGSSETGGIAWRQHTQDAHDEQWQPFAGINWRIDNGVLSIQSPYLPQSNQWFLTSDRIETSERGFRLLGRIDRIVKIEEKRVSLTAMEQLLTQVTGVIDARAVLLDQYKRGLAMIVVLDSNLQNLLIEQGKPKLVDMFTKVLRQQFESTVLPRRWRCIDQLPQDTQGKVSRVALAALFEPTAALVIASRRTNESVVLTLQIVSDLIFFDGHFPQAAILPGVALLQWAIDQAKSRFIIEKNLQRIDVLKFQKTIRQNCIVELVLSLDQATNTVSFSYQSKFGQHASGKLVFRGVGV